MNIGYQAANWVFNLSVLVLAWYGSARYRSSGLAALAMGSGVSIASSMAWMAVIAAATAGSAGSAGIQRNAVLIGTFSLVSGFAHYGFAIASVLLLMRDFKRYRERTEAAEAMAYRVNTPAP